METMAASLQQAAAGECCGLLCPPPPHPPGSVRRLSKRGLSVRASANGDSCATPLAPFQPVSPTGQFLAQLLQSHPHLVPAAVEGELEKLAENQFNERNQDQPNSSASEIVLYKRIAELKAQERRSALEEIIYTLIVQKFVEAGVSMVPSLSCLLSSEKPWPWQITQLEAIHSVEVLEMIWQHLAVVLGSEGVSDYVNLFTYTQISRVEVGKIYLTSMLYGYLLRRIHQRFRLEKLITMTPVGKPSFRHPENVDFSMQSGRRGLLQQWHLNKFQTYILCFGLELPKLAVLQCKESWGVLEKQTGALFGQLDLSIAVDGTTRINTDEQLTISMGGLKRLVLEALAFGSFLWEAEGYVDLSYNLCHP